MPKRNYDPVDKADLRLKKPRASINPPRRTPTRASINPPRTPSILGTRGAGKTYQTESILRSEQRRAETKMAEMEALRREVRKVEKQDKKPKSKKGIMSGLGLAGSFAGVATGLKTSINPPYRPNVLSSQVSKNRMKRKAFQKAQQLTRANEEEIKIQQKQIRDRELKRQQEIEQSETKLGWVDPDGTKSTFKFDGDGNLIGREIDEETQEKLKARKEQQEVDEAMSQRANDLKDGRLMRDRQGKALSQKQYRDSWATDPRTQKIIRQGDIVRQVRGGL